MQATLTKERIENFYHDHFVQSQVAAFMSLLGPPVASGGVVADIGGGCGFFARAIMDRGYHQVRVMDTDPDSVNISKSHGVEAFISDALKPTIRGDEDVVCFNLILHHLVGRSESATRKMQCDALRAWRGQARGVFVDEYIYESFASKRISGKLIWAITSNRLLSLVGRIVSEAVPSLRANTFGVGVRFRAREEWVELFEEAGFDVVGYRKGSDEGISLARRLLMIEHCRRDSFLLKPRTAAVGQGQRVSAGEQQRR